MKNEKIVLTGTSGSGKTTTLNYIKNNFSSTIKVLDETVRDIKKEGNIIEIQNNIMLSQLEKERRISNGIYILDRSLIDYIAYAKHFGMNELSLYFEKHLIQYDKIFFLEQIYDSNPVIFENYSLEQQKDMLLNEYVSQGYDVHFISQKSIDQRVHEILRNL